MAVSSAVVAVGTTATALNAASTGGVRLYIKNGDTAIDLGSSTVTSGSGYQLASSGTLVVELGPGDVLYAITASGTSNVQVLRS